MRALKSLAIGTGLLLGLTALGCSAPAEPPAAEPATTTVAEASAVPSMPMRRVTEGPVRIGLAMDTLEEERWHRDRQQMESRAKELGAALEVQIANGDDALQKKQCESMLDGGADVLIVVPHNAGLGAAIVDLAHARGVPVISYDRLIRNSDVDLYVAYEAIRIGKMQAEYALGKAPKGNYVLIGGASTDNNALLLRRGQMEALKDAMARGDVKLVSQQFAAEWRPEAARRIMEESIRQTGGDIRAVVASNDGTAGGAIEALTTAGLAGKVVVTGQDAEKEAIRRIVRGTQSMTIYKPIRPLAFAAVDAAFRLARGETVDAPELVDNGKREIRSVLLEPVVVDRASIDSTVIADGFHRRQEIY